MTKEGESTETNKEEQKVDQKNKHTSQSKQRSDQVNPVYSQRHVPRRH